MNTNQLLVWIIIAAVVFGSGYLLLSNQGSNDTIVGEEEEVMEEEDAVNDSMMKEKEGMVKDEGMMEKDGAMMQKGRYEEYSPEKLALASTDKVVLYFHADWCPICRPLDAALKSGVPEGVRILEVDYDTATELKRKYGVTYQHTFVQVDAQGKLIAKWGDAFTPADVFARVK